MKYILLLFIVAAVLLPVAMPNLVLAQSTTSGSGVPIPNPIKCNDINCLISQVIRYILGTIAIVATLMFIWGGFMMLTSGGSAERIKKAKETLAWATIGIVVIMLSWAIIRFVLQGLINTSGSSTTTTTQTEPTGCCVIAPGNCPTTTAAQCASPSVFHSGQICTPAFGC